MQNSELIKLLKTLPKDANIFLSSDEEGNNFTILDGIEKVEKNNSNSIILWAGKYVEIDEICNN